MRRFHHLPAGWSATDRPSPTESRVPGSGRPHAWARRYTGACGPVRTDDRVAVPVVPAVPVVQAAPLTGIHYITMPDAAARDALATLVAEWRRAAAECGESLVQFAERCLFTDAPPPRRATPSGLAMRPPATSGPRAAHVGGPAQPLADEAFTLRRVSDPELQSIGQPIVRIEVQAPDTLESLGDLVVRWARLAGGQAWAFIEIGRRHMFNRVVRGETHAPSDFLPRM